MKVPFLLSIVLVGIGLIIRLRIRRRPRSRESRRRRRAARQPILEVLARYLKQVLLAMGARFAENGAFYIFSGLRPDLCDAARQHRPAARPQRNPPRIGG